MKSSRLPRECIAFEANHPTFEGHGEVVEFCGTYTIADWIYADCVYVSSGVRGFFRTDQLIPLNASARAALALVRP